MPSPRPTTALLTLLLAWGCDRGEPDAGESTPADEIPAAYDPARAPRLRPLSRELQTTVVPVLRQGRFEAARELARAQVEASPDDGQAVFLLGLTYDKTGNYGAALPHFEKALALAPDYYIAHDYLGYCHFMLGDLVAARREFQAYRAADPREPKAHYRLGLVDLEESRLDDAALRFERAIQLFDELRGINPSFHAARAAEIAECHARLADVHFARDDYEAARDALLVSTRIAPRNISAFYTLALVHRRLGEDDLADAASERYESARRAIVDGARATGD